MNDEELSLWSNYLFLILWLAIATVVGRHFWPLMQYSIRVEQSPSWPTVAATITGATTGIIDAGQHHYSPAAFMTYRYSVNERQLEGKFVLSRDTTVRLDSTKDRLVGAEIDVRYQPGNPSISILSNFHDPRFGAFSASQNPLFLRKDTEASIRDAMKRI